MLSFEKRFRWFSLIILSCVLHQPLLSGSIWTESEKRFIYRDYPRFNCCLFGLNNIKDSTKLFSLNTHHQLFCHEYSVCSSRLKHSHVVPMISSSFGYHSGTMFYLQWHIPNDCKRCAIPFWVTFNASLSSSCISHESFSNKAFEPTSSFIFDLTLRALSSRQIHHS